MTSNVALPAEWTLVIDIPSRKGQLRHPLPPRPEQVRKLLGDLAAFVPGDAAWSVSPVRKIN